MIILFAAPLLKRNGLSDLTVMGDEAEQKFGDAKRFLQKEPPLGGSSLHDHLTQVVLKLIVERPDDANMQFEQLSLALRSMSAEKLAKAASDAAAAAAAAASVPEPEPEPVEPKLDENGDPIKPKKKKASAPTGPLTPEEALKQKVSAWIARHAYLFPVPEKPEPEEGADEEEEPEEPEEEDPGTAGPVSEVLDDAVLWSWAGVGFGETQTFRLFRSLQLLAGREGGEVPIRFWGKVLGRQGDYFVCCALTEQTGSPDPFEADEDTEEKIHFKMPPGLKDFEAEGLDGPNKWTYWVASDPSGAKDAWTKLPHVTPEQVMAARAHRKYLTGDLASPVACFPPLPGGTEAHLLRAYIAEITADTSLGLAGLFEVDEDGMAEDPPIAKARAVEEEDEESAKYFTSTELKLLESWVHTECDLRANGRCQVKPAPEDDEDGGGGDAAELDDKKAKFFAAFGAADAPQDSDASALKPPCRPIADDVDSSTGKGQWAVRVCPSGPGTTLNAFAVARSLKWPGAVTVAAGYQSPATPGVKHRRRTTSVYVGHGVPRSANPVGLQMPAPLGAEASLPSDEQADVVVEPPKEEEDE
jgi:radial spoke head protein 4A